MADLEHSPDSAIQGPGDTDREGEHADARRKEVRSLDPTPLTELQFAAGVIDRVIAGPTRTLDEDNGRKQCCCRRADKKQCVSHHCGRSR